MAGNAETILVRVAEAGDYEAVLDIVPDLYGGADYMPHTYHSYLSDPNAHPYLCEVDGVIASFGMHYVVDQGQTGIWAAARTMERYTGRGLSSRVRTASLRAARQHHPHLQTESHIVIDSEYNSQFRKPNSKHFTLVYELYWLQYLTTRKAVYSLAEQLERTVMGEAAIMDKETSVTVLPDILLKSNVFDDTRFVAPTGFKAFKVNRENLADLASITDVVATFTSTAPERVCAAVSFGCFLPCKIGPSLIVFFYGKSIKDYFIHLKAHLRHRKEEFSGEGGADFEIGFPLGIPVEEVKRGVYASLGDNDLHPELPRETALVIERPVTAAGSSSVSQ